MSVATDESRRISAELSSESGYYFHDLKKLVHFSVMIESPEDWPTDGLQLSVIESRIRTLSDQLLLNLPESRHSYEVQDKCRQHCVTEFSLLKELVDALRIAEIVLPPGPRQGNDTLEGLWKRFITEASAELDILLPQIVMHEKVVSLLMASGKQNPSDILSQFIENVLYPAFDARYALELLLITQSAHVGFPKRYGEEAIQTREAVAKATSECVAASSRAEKAYDEVIPLLRFGYLALRGQIWEDVDKPFALGARRTDVLPTDFVRLELPRSFVAETHPEAQELKKLDKL
jgi:hypothetical protein